MQRLRGVILVEIKIVGKKDLSGELKAIKEALIKKGVLTSLDIEKEKQPK